MIYILQNGSDKILQNPTHWGCYASSEESN